MKTSVFYTLYVVACLSVILWVHTMDSAEHVKKDDHVEPSSLPIIKSLGPNN
jgi:hypothetical protein